MKKKYIIIAVILVCVAAAAVIICFQPEQGDISGTETEFGESQFFTDRELRLAANALKAEFQTLYPQYSLDKVWYVDDRRQLDDDRDVEYDGRNIILYSSFTRKTAAPEDAGPEQYNHYRWCVAVDDWGRWSVVEHGF